MPRRLPVNLLAIRVLEIKTLTLAAAMIDMWNRLNVALRTVPGGYKPGMFRELRRAQA